MKRIYFQADIQSDGAYWPTEYSHNLDDILNNFEYGDVVFGTYQIWEYPSGKIYAVSADKVMDDHNYYSSPSEDTWRPIIIPVKESKSAVDSAYNHLVKH
jgi:hypothetical protein